MTAATATNGDTATTVHPEPIVGPTALSAALLSVEGVIGDTTAGGNRHHFLEAVRLVLLRLPAGERAAVAALLSQVASTTGVSQDQALRTIQYVQSIIPGAERK